MPQRLLASLSHVELMTPSLQKSVDYARDILGLDVVDEVGDSVYLRCSGDYYLYSLVLTAGAGPGLGDMAWRSEGPEQLTEAARVIETSGAIGERFDGQYGHGWAFRFIGPGGHIHELSWDVERAIAPAGEAATYPERPQHKPSRGIGVRILDHATVTTPEVKQTAEWIRENVGSRIMAGVEPAPWAPWVFAVTTNNEKAHDLGLIQDFEGERGRMHHVAFWVETNHDLTEGAKFIVQHSHEIDQGPGQHRHQGAELPVLSGPCRPALRTELRRVSQPCSGLGAGHLAPGAGLQQRVPHRDRNAGRRPGSHPGGCRRLQRQDDGPLRRHGRGGSRPLVTTP